MLLHVLVGGYCDQVKISRIRKLRATLVVDFKLRSLLVDPTMSLRIEDLLISVSFFSFVTDFILKC